MSQPQRAATPYHWAPGAGPDPRALARMCERFRRPPAPMGEAWFMAEERRMYDALMAGEPAQWPREDLADALCDLASGPTSFGHLREWSDWLPYLLPRVVPLIGPWATADLYETLVTAVMIHCPDSEGPYFYAGFRDDLLATLGRVLLGPALWQEGRLGPKTALSTLDHTVNGFEFTAGEGFSAASFLVAKYLERDRLDGWMASVAGFDDPLWRAKWVIWLSHGSKLLLEPDSQPIDLPQEGNGAGWDWSWVISGSTPSHRVDPAAPVSAFLDPQRQAALQGAVRRCIRASGLATWREELDQLQYVHDVDLALALRQFDEAVKFVVPAYRLR